MNISILGSGNGGLAAAVDLTLQGFHIRLWSRTASTLIPIIEKKGVEYRGVLGNGFAPLDMISTDLEKVVDGAELIMICLPTLALADIGQKLSQFKRQLPPVFLNPGHTGGALEFMANFKKENQNPLSLAECSTLTYVARKQPGGIINISGVARHVWIAALPGGRQALESAQTIYPFSKELKDVIGTGLANVNMVLHPPGAILGASWIESTKGDFTFYVEGLTKGVSKIMDALDNERLSVAGAYDHDLPDLFHEMQMIGTIEKDADPLEGLDSAIKSGKANRYIQAPHSLDHRYYKEDFWYGIQPFLALADIANVDVPIAQSLMNIAKGLTGPVEIIDGRTKSSMGIDTFTRDQLLNYLIMNH